MEPPVKVQVPWFENFDLESIVTPVDVQEYERLLIQSKFSKRKRIKLVKGFTEGFSLGYDGEKNIQKKAANLPFRIRDEFELWSKVMKEVEVGRYAGPFTEIPFDNYVQSPIGLVPKDGGKKTRLIFHLSYPKNGDSVNSGIPDELCKVNYPEFDEAVKLCLKAGKSCYAGKSDMSMAFRNIPLNRESRQWLVMKAVHPVMKVTYYFVDKCLPFGSSISCKVFQDFSDSVAHLVKFNTQKDTVNYLDDFFFVALLKLWCDWQVTTFLSICQQIKFPVSLEKTFWGDTRIVFLGLLLDTIRQVVCIPQEKVDRARQMINLFLEKNNKKVTVHQLQKLTGFLNFLCKCIVPGRAFTRRLYITGNLLPHYHIRITPEMRMDLQVWQKFLARPDIFCRPFMDYQELTVEDINMYSDAAKTVKRGFGAYCDNSWLGGKWDPIWFESSNPSIEYLELYAVTLVVVTWIHRFKKKKFTFLQTMKVLRI